jgi:integrase
MSIRKHGRGWQVRLPGEKAATFPTKAAAETHELSRRISRSLGPGGQAEAPITVSEMLSRHLERWQAREQPRASTVRRKHQHADAISRGCLGDMLLTQVRFVHVDDHFTSRAARHSNAAKKELELFKRALREAKRRGQRFDPELLNVEPIMDTNRRGQALDIDELDQLASWFPDQLANWVLLGGTTAWRPGEGLDLTDDRFDPDHGSIFVPAHLNKEGRDKTIMLMPDEIQRAREQLLLRQAGTRLLFPNPDGERWAGRWFYLGVWHPACQAAAREWRQERGLPRQAPTPFDGMVPHDLRHTGISLMARAGMRPEQIAERVGHKDGGALIHRRYRHLFPDEMAERLLAFQSFLTQRRATAQGTEAVEGRQ